MKTPNVNFSNYLQSSVTSTVLKQISSGRYTYSALPLIFYFQEHSFVFQSHLQLLLTNIIQTWYLQSPKHTSVSSGRVLFLDVCFYVRSSTLKWGPFPSARLSIRLFVYLLWHSTGDETFSRIFVIIGAGVPKIIEQMYIL